MSLGAIGPYDDPAADPGGPGSLSAKTRLLTAQIDSLRALLTPLTAVLSGGVSDPLYAASGSLGRIDTALNSTLPALLQTLLTPLSGDIGEQANAWNAAAVASGGVSTAIDTSHSPFVTAFGNCVSGTVLTMQLSQNNSTFFSGPTYSLPTGGDFWIDATVGARWVRLKSSLASVITATIAAKR